MSWLRSFLSSPPTSATSEIKEADRINTELVDSTVVDPNFFGGGSYGTLGATIPDRSKFEHHTANISESQHAETVPIFLSN
jgi:hypothetical protein